MGDMVYVQRAVLDEDDVVKLLNTDDRLVTAVKRETTEFTIQVEPEISMVPIHLAGGETVFASEKFIDYLEHNGDWEVVEEE